MVRLVLISLILIINTSCSLINKAAVKTTGSIVAKGSDELLTESNWAYLEKALPGNLKLMEALWFNDQANKVLLTSLIKGFAAHAFAISETKALKGILLENSNDDQRDQAILFYEKAIFYGLKYLEVIGISSKKFFDKSYSYKIDEDFSTRFDEDDFVALFYFAQSLGSSINLQRQNIVKLGYFNHVKSLLNWICTKEPELERGSCQLFDAVIEASTSGLLGGSMQKAKLKFKALIKKQPYNLLAKASYIQYYIIPMLEEDEFSVEMEQLQRDLNTWYSLQLGKTTKASKLYENHRDFNLFNSVARERFGIMHKLRKNIFE